MSLDEAERVAKHINVKRKERAPSNNEILEAFRAIEEWPEQCRPNVAPGGAKSPMVTGVVLGLTPNRTGSCSISQASVRCPELTRLTTAWVSRSVGEAFRFGSIQVNYNYRARKHIDSNNLGPSYIYAFDPALQILIDALGNHEGGALWTSDRGVLDCRGKWRLFDGNTEHETLPFKGKERITFIAFTPDAYNRLSATVYEQSRALGLTAAATDGVDDGYFSQFRDLGTVDERDFDAYTEGHHHNHPPRVATPGDLCVETNGYAAGRGWGWIAFRGNSSDDRLEPVEGGGRLARFKKNQTGIHVVDLNVVQSKGDIEFDLVDIHRFGLYQHTISESKRFKDWVDSLPHNRVVCCCITDTAMAKTRPIPAVVYQALTDLGAPPDLTLIGYREPFCFVGWKGASPGAAAYMLDARKQSKTLLRIDANLHIDGARQLSLTAQKSQFKLLDEIERHIQTKKRSTAPTCSIPNGDAKRTRQSST